MSLLASIPLVPCLAILFLAGLVYGSAVNWAVYSLAFHRRAISPWSPAAGEAPPRRWYDRLPVLGWLSLRREAALHGPGFWVRPLLVEVVCGVGLAALYWWEIDRQGLYPLGTRPDGALTAHIRYFAHVVLIWFMLAGSLIDIDEKTLPDAVTLPGTWIGLLLAVLFPWSLLPAQVPSRPAVWPAVFSIEHAPGAGFLHLAAPSGWPDWLGGFPQWPALGLGLACWWFWCFALMDRRWYGHLGFRRALKYLAAGLLRRPSTRWIALMGVAGSALIVAAWMWSGPHWQGLLSALVGMVASGCVVWAIRLVGGWALGREAMGFGDVTLMGMIGCYLGWQPCLVVFFFAPFAALFVGLFTLVIHRQSEIPYGPFLCLLALIVLVGWAWIWPQAEPVFALGWLLILVLVVCLALMPALLMLIRLLRGLAGF